MRAIAFTLMCIASWAALSATVYKWVDADGVTHYSDQPHPGAQRVEVQGAQTYAAPAKRRESAAKEAAAAAGPVYSSCEINKPTNDQVFLNASSVPANVHMDPPLRPGDRLVVSLDGVPSPGTPPAESDFVLTALVRGSHTLAVTVVEDSTGNVVCQSPGVTFHVRQPSLLAPNQPGRAH